MEWRTHLWIAPRLHQFLFATGILLVGGIQLLSRCCPFDTVGMRYTWLVFSKPSASACVAIGLVGLVTALGNGGKVLGYARVAFAMGNVAFYTALCWIFGTQLRVGTIIYPMVLLWSVWFMLRTIADKFVKVSIVRIVEVEVRHRE